jgi:ribonuclease D
VDPLKISELRPVWDLLENPGIQKISHGCQSDLVLLDYRYNVHPRNIFDTQKASQLLGYETTSLSALLERYFNLVKNMKVRVSDWNKRPLTDKMIEYAALDVEHLSELADKLEVELRERDRWDWFTEECALLEDVRYKPKENPSLELPGVRKLTRRQKHVLRAIYNMRESIAAEMDKPAYHIMANPRMLELAVDVPRSVSAWGNMTAVHSVVGRRAEDFHNAVQKALTEELPAFDPSDRNFPPSGMSLQDFRVWSEERVAILEPLQLKIQEQYPDVAAQIMSTRTLKRLAFGEIVLAELRKWQQKILLEQSSGMGIDLQKLNLI